MMKDKINLLEIDRDVSYDELLELIEYFKKRLHQETMVDNILCKCGEVVWMFKDTITCPKCNEVLYKT